MDSREVGSHPFVLSRALFPLSNFASKPSVTLTSNANIIICSNLLFVSFASQHQSNHRCEVNCGSVSPICGTKLATLRVSYLRLCVALLSDTAIINKAIPEVESLIDVYPKRFPCMEDVKLFIANVCRSYNFDYGLDANATAYVELHVKNQVHFLVGIRAWRKGEFYLDVPLHEPGVLRRKLSRYLASVRMLIGTGAVQADIDRIESTISEWPPFFPTLNHAKAHVQRLSLAVGFKYGEFPGIPAHRFRMYVDFNTARNAYEAGKFVCQNPLVESDGFVLQQKQSANAQTVTPQHPVVPFPTTTAPASVPSHRVQPSPSSVRSDDTYINPDLPKVSTAPCNFPTQQITKGEHVKSSTEESLKDLHIPFDADTQPIEPSECVSRVPALLLFDLDQDVLKSKEKLEKTDTVSDDQEDPFKASRYGAVLCGVLMTLVQGLLDELRRAFIIKTAFE